MEHYIPKGKVDITDPNEEQKKKAEKVISGSVKTKKKDSMQKFADVFIAEDMHSVKEYVFMDVILPTLKRGLYDIITNGLQMALYGERGSGSKNRNVPVYNSIYQNGGGNSTRHSVTTRTPYSFDDIVLETRADAEDVLEGMIDICERYGSVSVADMYDLVGITGEWTDNKYGWSDLRSAHIERVKEGYYVIRLPRVLPLK